MKLPSGYVLKRTATVTLIAAAISISFSTGIRMLVGAESDLITIIVRLVLPFVIAIPIGLIWFSRLEKLDRSYRKLVKETNILVRHASTDPLTGLLNRRSFVEQFELALSHGIKGSFLIADVDDLKKINDQFGHVVGDEAIIATANALQNVLSEDSLIARIGGDEFCAFLPQQDSHGFADIQDEIDDQALAEYRSRTGRSDLVLSISCGYASCKANQTFGEVLGRADTQLYRTKRSRKAAAA